MNIEMEREIRKKETKTVLEEEFLKYQYVLATISEILVSESKFHITSEVAIKKIRQLMIENLN